MVRAIRGLLAIIVLSAVLFYTLSNVIFAPVKETALSPVKSFRISGYTPSDLLEDINIPAWDVTYALPYESSITGADLTSLISQDQFFSAVNVTAVWPSNILLLVNNSELVLPVCHQKALPDAHTGVPYYFYHCPPIPTETSYILPDLQINVDFGPLMDVLSNIAQASARTQLPLLIGLANDLYDDIIRTVPVTFLPGVNMAASVIVDVRQVYTNGALAALGIFEITRTFWLPRLVAFYPDTAATFTGSNLSSLNIFWQRNYGELAFVQDYRENSVVAGFSSVGGLWTAFSGIFAIIFGASMLHTLYGSKPLSIFGIAHQFQAETMKKEAKRLYPNIMEENRSLEQRGLLSLLRDHLIDLSFLDDKNDNSSGSLEGRIKKSDEERVDSGKVEKSPVTISWRDTDSSEIQNENGSTSNT
ncbi:hypothetical protein HYPSUDRAFT_213835 [Hypholoma sublateritium FD-334 SS-4]|uniref:Uncharacterized protein n=1 Tax=Hypholoma sublateritium (strain FD-334 SS-4) TaxID=945553 RepID=A0A0D2P3H2_HYPSF|nr:hypothetical protein HYPSUDRAFT_213835 [Hypholoma sublateritium FD-334 SS-4]